MFESLVYRRYAQFIEYWIRKKWLYDLGNIFGINFMEIAIEQLWCGYNLLIAKKHVNCCLICPNKHIVFFIYLIVNKQKARAEQEK